MENISLEGEVWKDVVGYEGLYKVSNTGRVLSFKYKQPKELLPAKNKRMGHLFVCLYKDKLPRRFLVHRLVASCFLSLDLYSWGDGKTSICVCHKDDNPNNNKVSNLFLGTNKDNVHDMMKKGRGGWKYGEENHRYGKEGYWKGKLGEESPNAKRVYQIKSGKVINVFSSTREASIITGIQQANISTCALGKRNIAGGFSWKYSI